MVQFRAQLMEIDVEARGVGDGEKSAERLNSRNGYRDRTRETRAGAVEVKIPKLRQGSDFPEFLEPRRKAEKTLTAAIREACIKRISTRSVDDLVKAMGRSGDNDALASMTFARAHWSQTCITNPLERLDAEIKRRTNCVPTPLDGTSSGRSLSR